MGTSNALGRSVVISETGVQKRKSVAGVGQKRRRREKQDGCVETASLAGMVVSAVVLVGVWMTINLGLEAGDGGEQDGRVADRFD